VRPALNGMYKRRILVPVTKQANGLARPDASAGIPKPEAPPNPPAVDDKENAASFLVAGPQPKRPKLMVKTPLHAAPRPAAPPKAAAEESEPAFFSGLFTKKDLYAKKKAGKKFADGVLEVVEQRTCAIYGMVGPSPHPPV
jgi:hypothetical protein